MTVSCVIAYLHFMTKDDVQYFFYDPACYPLLDIARLVVRTNLWSEYQRGLVPDFNQAVQHISTARAIGEWAYQFNAVANLPEENPLFASYIAVEGDKPVGFVVTGHDVWDESKMTGEVKALSVHQDVWGSGIGSRLLSIAEMHLQSSGCRRITLCVEDNNQQAIRRYQKAGWSHAEGVFYHDIINGRRAMFLEYEKNF